MKTMPVSKFKAQALREFNRVAATREGVIVTRRGKPLAKVVPYQPESAQPGGLSHTLVREGDIVSPLGPDAWEATR